MRHRRGRRRYERGQAIVESVLVLMLLIFIFFALFQVAWLYKGQMIADHAAFVTARSYVVGFDHDVVLRAAEVGTIPMAGPLTYPANLAAASAARRWVLEPLYIERFLRTPGYLLRYQHWNLLDIDLPPVEDPGLVDVRVRMDNYPLEFPLQQAYLGRRGVNLEGDVHMLNHAAYYLQ